MQNENSTPLWYAAYTRCNHERTAAEQMKRRSIENFVPTYETVRTWKDRRKRLEMPLFPGYVFVRVAIEERLSVLVVPGVVRLVGFDNRPVPVADEEIESLRMIVSRKLRPEPHPFLPLGRKVRIKSGALEGVTGILVRKKGCARLLISIDLIRQSAVVEIDSADAEAI
jgi:transcription antitermination factor NusG